MAQNMNLNSQGFKWKPKSPKELELLVALAYLLVRGVGGKRRRNGVK